MQYEEIYLAAMRQRVPSYKILLFMLAVLVGACIVQGWWHGAFMTFPILLLTLHSYRIHRAWSEAEHRHGREVADLHLRTIEALAAAIDAKDNTTHQHLQRVVIYAESIGKELKLGEDDLRALRAAALLHDIGKLAVPEYIISKPGRLTEEEFEKMKIHTIVGAEILERVQFPYPVVPIVRAHHERWNGSGYPDGLKGEQIPIGARILAVVDSFDALSSDRQYRRALSQEAALAAVKKEAGVLFDRRVVEVLDRVHPRIEAALKSMLQPPRTLSLNAKVERGDAPVSGLSVERASDSSSALQSIAQAKEELQILYELTQALGNSLNLEGTFRLLTDQLQKLITFDTIAIYLVQDNRLIPRFVEGVNAALLARMPVPLGEGLSGWVAATGKSSLNGNPAVEPGYVHDPRQFSELRGALSVPLESNSGIIGALTLYSVRQNAFAVDHLRVLKAVGLKAASAIHNALIHEAIGRTAETDPLTGLPNARALWPRLDQEAVRAAREELPFSVFVLDMDGLKRINDTFGHLTGNKVLKAVAAALRSHLREYDLVARLGGDEFVVVLPGLNAEAAAEKRIDLCQTVAGVRDSFPGVDVSFSMGSASFPADSREVKELMTIADRRMYRHKREYHKSVATGDRREAAELHAFAETATNP